MQNLMGSSKIALRAVKNEVFATKNTILCQNCAQKLLLVVRNLVIQRANLTFNYVFRQEWFILRSSKCDF